ncbi:50S ribosomal protein L15 [Candidatus Uhrbacteria bacterium]|jgi:large subunit ribosomal protein L15|nr:50S ribosomal protein L15 [Candidatus Uhrbacteria bacterium]
MSISLDNLTPSKGRAKGKKRLGRGLASRGTTSGRGQKGQKSRSGSSGFKRRGLRRLILSTPKLRGFKSPHVEAETVNVGVIAENYIKDEVVSPRTLKQKGLIPTILKGAKILGEGEISITVSVKGCSVSKSAAEKITAAGGTIEA